MNVVIIEDETLSAQRLEKMILEIEPSLKILAKLESIESAVEWFRGHGDPDLIFLDIHLEDGLSFSIFDRVDVQSPIIFTTAYDEYAIKAFKLKSIDYLLKPITREELEKSILKYRNWTLPEKPVIDIKALYEMMRPEKQFKSRFSVTIGDRIKSIPASEVAFFYSAEGITFMVCTDTHEFTLDASLETLEHDLDPAKYFRINRQFLVGLESVVQAHIYPKSRLKLELKPDPRQEVFVSIDRVTGFKRWLEGRTDGKM